MSMPPFTAKHLQQQSHRIDAIVGIIHHWSDREVMRSIAAKLMRHALALLAIALKGEVDDADLHRKRARYHAVARAWGRFDLAISFDDLADIEERIRGGKAVWIKDLAGGPRQAWMVPYEDQLPIVIFDIRLDCAVTFLPDVSYLGDAEEDRSDAA